MAALSGLQYSTSPLQKQAVRHLGYPLDSSYRNSELNAAKGI